MSALIRTLESVGNSDEEVDDGDIVMSKGFSFDGDEDPIQNAWDFNRAIQDSMDKTTDKQTTIDQKIQQQLSRKRKRSDFEEESDDDAEDPELVPHMDDQDDQEVEADEEDISGDEGATTGEIEAEEEEESEEEEGSDDDGTEGPKTFTDLHLSRTLLKACSKLGYVKPTPIQRRSIPFALAGKDICGSAHTGSGKTAAFMLPVLERLLYRPKRIPVIRVLVLTPTRELAAQCNSMTEKLAQFSDIRTCLVVGGLSNKIQETSLRRRPDIVIATPGRMIDHLRNAQSVTLDSVEVLILDEADRLLDMGFTEELNEIVKCCPKTRQTLLFSATMSKKVMKLASISLKEPVYVAVNRQLTVASGLRQEFVRIKATREQDREAMLVALCKKTYKEKTIIFVRAKRYAHYLKIIFGLFGLQAAELHGNLTQTARLEALEDFRDQKVKFLIATDLASRGLDIVGIESVINFNMPRSHEQYIHRVGRTARAGNIGSSCSFVSEDDRQLLKEIIKKDTAGVHQRKVAVEVIEKYQKKLHDSRDDMERIIQEEREERAIRLAERDVDKAENLMEYEDEIQSRPKRTWFQTTKEKLESQKRSQVAMFGEDETQETEEQENQGGEKEEFLSKRQFQRKLRQERESSKLQRKTERKKKNRQFAVDSVTPVMKQQLKASKSQYKAVKFNTIEGHGKQGGKGGKSSGSSGAPPKKKRKANPFAATSGGGKKKSEFSQKFKSKKRYKRR